MTRRRHLRRYFRWLRVPSAVKDVTNPLVGWIPIRIRSGVNRGLRWSLASAGGGYGSGTRAAREMQVVAGLVQPGERVWDVGAHHGFVTLCAAVRAGPGGRVDAFEPSSRSRWFLQRHVAWNRLGNVRVHPCALGGFDGRSRLGGGGTSKQHALGTVGEEVGVRRARSLIEAGTCPVPTFVKIDVEGAEAEVLEDLVGVLGPGARVLVSVHSPELADRCRRLLEGSGWRCVASEEVEAKRREGWKGDAGLYGCAPGYGALDDELEVLRRARF